MRRRRRTHLPTRTAPGVLERTQLLLLGMVALAVPALVYPGAAESSSIKTLVFNLLVIALAWVMLARLAAGDRLELPRSRLNLGVGLYLAAALVSAAFSHYRWASVNQLLKLGSYAVFYLAVVTGVRSHRQTAGLMRWVGAGAGLVAAYAIWQRLGLDWWHWSPFDPQHGRVISSFGNPTFLAGYLILLLPVADNLATSGSRQPDSAPSPLARWAWWILALAMPVCLFWTYARAAWVGLAAAMAVNEMLVRRRAALRPWNRGWLLVAKVVVLAAIIPWQLPPLERQRAVSSFSQADPANVQRMMFWRGGEAIFKQHPLLGTGPGTFQIYLPARLSPEFWRTGVEVYTAHAHNELVEVASEMGVVGLAAFAVLLVSFSLTAWDRLRSRHPLQQALVAGAAAGIIAFLIQNAAGVTFRWTGPVVFFWLMLGLTGADLAPAARELSGTKTRPGRMAFGRWVLLVIAGAAALVAGWRVCLPFRSEIHLRTAEVNVDQGNLCQQQNDWDLARAFWNAAEQDLEGAIELNPYALRAYYKLGHVLNMQGYALNRQGRRWDAQARYQQALSAFERLSSLHPDYIQIHYNLGAVQFNLGRLPEAEQEYLRAIKQENSPLNYRALAALYQQMGRPRQSAAALAAAKRLESGRGER